MLRKKILSTVFVLSIALSIAALPSMSLWPGTALLVSASADKQKKGKQAKSDSEKDKKTLVDPSEGHPMLWKAPADIESLDLFYGPGGREGAPNLSDKFTFVERDTNGTQLKIYVKDSEGRDWTVKFGPEARPETTATRIVWAMGYHADEDYFVKSVHIDGWKGEAVSVRFKRRHNGFKDVGLWTWEHNPFNGTRELDGLKVLMALLNNWDLKYDNNKVLKPDKKSGEDPDERIYYVGDLGASFGKTGSLAHKIHFPGDPPAGTKDKPDQYARQSFITGVDNGAVHFHYKGKDHAALQGIPVQNARWMGTMLGRLSDKQLADAFRAGGYSDSEVSLLVRAMHERIAELQNLK
jgi:hypothetical protein